MFFRSAGVPLWWGPFLVNQEGSQFEGGPVFANLNGSQIERALLLPIQRGLRTPMRRILRIFFYYECDRRDHNTYVNENNIHSE